MEPPLPLNNASVEALVASHKRNGPGKERAPAVYTAQEARRIENALSRDDTTMLTPLLRVVLRTELRKLYAA
eukprot:660929-Pyramimonas_sp.AAC.1